MLAYLALAGVAWWTGRGLPGALAVFVLVTLLLWPGLRGRSVAAWLAWCAAGVLLAWLAGKGAGRFALDLAPALVVATLCVLFARTLRRPRRPLIALFIEVVEAPSRLEQPGVADYARALTWVWAIMLGMQAALLLSVAVLLPEGPVGWIDARRAAAWRAWLHAGSWLTVIGLLVVEYAWRRWYLRRVPHLPPAEFARRLVARWPAIVRRIARDVEPPR